MQNSEAFESADYNLALPNATTGTNHIELAHWHEWVTDSAVDPYLTSLNVVSLSNFEPYERLLYALSDSDRRNDGRLRDKWLKRYAHTEHGGWWCSGIDVLTGEDADWGQFKPDIPYHYQKQCKGFDPSSNAKNKIIKYEAPPQVPTEIIALCPTWAIGFKIARRYNLEQEYSQRFFANFPEIETRKNGYATKDRGFWQWVRSNPCISTIITEGAKKAGVLLTAGYVAIALPGIYNGYRQPKDQWGHKIGNPYLIPQLQAFAQKDRKIIFCFDQDSKPKTATNVRSAIALTGKLFERFECRVSVISWNYAFKGVDDLISNRGVDCFHTLYKARIPLSKFQLITLLNLSEYAPLIVNERYLNENLVPPPDAQVIGIKSPKGTGKTEWLSKIVANATRSGQRVIIICHREQLALALANRFGIDYRTEVKTSVTKGLFGYALCIDSLHPHANPPFNPDEWQGALVIIDEVEQVFWHLLNSSTCQNNRIAIIESFKQLLLTAVGTGVYLADADLSPIALDYVRSLIGFPVQTWVVENIYNSSKFRKLINYSGNDPRELVAALVKAIGRQEKVLVHTTGQKARSKWGSINLESYLEKIFPKHQILRIDSESVAEPGHRAYGCMGNLNAILPLYDIVICSPVVETGVSIDLKGHFDSVWGIAQGIQTVDAVCQALERLRDNVPRHLWVKTTAKGNRIGNGSTNIRCLLASEHKLTRANISLLQQASISEFDALEVNSSPESLNTWAKRACVVNAGKNNYREEIVSKLIIEGYEISSEQTDEQQAGKVVNESMGQTRSENYQRYCQAVPQVETPTDSELEELKNKRAKTKTERLAERKGNLTKRYGVEVTSELVEKDDNGWYSQLQLHYYLSVGNIYLAERDQRTLSKIKEQGNGKAFKPDINKRQLSAKVKALQLINIGQFLNLEAEFTNDSLQDWYSTILKCRYDIKTILGVSINPDKDSAIAVVQRILKKLGLKLVKKHQVRRNGKRVRVYQGCHANTDGREFVFANWLDRDQQKSNDLDVTPFIKEDIYTIC
jgi:Domain of unknown function (DUF3854)